MSRFALMKPVMRSATPLVGAAVFCLVFSSVVRADDPVAETRAVPTAKADAAEKDGAGGDKPGGAAAPGGAPAAAPPPYAMILKDAKAVSGLMNMYVKGGNLIAELGPGGEYSNEYIVLIALARGISQGQLLGGMTWGNGDDWIWTFRKVDDKVHIVRKNVRFRANRGTPEATAVNNAYKIGRAHV